MVAIVAPAELPLGVFNPMVPKEGPRIIPMKLDLTVANSILVDLSQQQQQGRISFIQTIYVDNSLNTAFVDIVSAGLNMKYRVDAGQQALLPFFVMNPPKFTVSTTGGVVVPVFVMNVPIPAQVWNSSGGSGVQLVSDPALEALIMDLGGGPALNVNVVEGGGGGGGTAAQVLYWARATNAGNINLNGPSAAGKQFTCTGIDVSLSPDAANSVGETQEFLINAGNTGPVFAWNGTMYVPAAAPAILQAGIIPCIQLTGLSIAAQVGDQPICVWFLTHDLISGFLNVNVYGTLV